MSFKNIEDFSRKILSIRCISFDCEGILTLNARQYRPPFNTVPMSDSDSNALKRLIASGFFTIAVITRSKSPSLKIFLQTLGVDYLYTGMSNKMIAYEELKYILQLTDKECCHMGDGDPDLPLLQKAGLAITVPHAPKSLQECADYCTTAQGGWGAVKETVDLILNTYKKGQLE
ncbi:hypothetical protein EBR43_01730 [bacterium]|nr:hypothetical protein [bacterium]NBW56507.1 hypothetical protein [bacterium]NBX72586.1 hypothetical protein [bacterium]